MQRYLFLLLPLLFAQCASLDESAYRHIDHQQVIKKNTTIIESADFKSKLATVAKASWHNHCEVKTLPNGDAFFPAMREAVNSAKKSITFETFAMVSGTESYYFCKALGEKAQQGVKVHVILDGVGSRKLGKVCTDLLVKNGVQLHWYRKINPLRMYHSNNRDHRKLLVVDGKVGFIGGAGYANSWMGNASGSEEWRDTMYQVKGKAVADMQRTFADNWKEITQETLTGNDYYPTLSDVGNQAVQITMGAPRERGDTLGASYLLSIDAAQKSILIEHAYFAPRKELRDAIKRACARGVKVKVILPGDPIDSKILREASKIYWRELMAVGVEIYEYQTSMMHAKLMVIDDYLTIAGSGNFDDRTYFINDEANIHILSREVANYQKHMFNNDINNCKRMTPVDSRVKLKSIPLRLGAYLVMPQL